MKPVRVLIVDDSASMRAILTQILSEDPEIEVVGAAPEPHQAREMIKELNPDVLTLDVEMPGMDGLSFLERIMRLRPMPVVMCSSLTAAGAEASIEALRLGAVDCIGKPAGGPEELMQSAAQFRSTVKGAGRARARNVVRFTPVRAKPPAPTPNQPPFRDVIIALGASTGGVEALFHVLGDMPADCPPVLVVQHMPAAFTASFAERLNRRCAPTVMEAVDGTVIQRGHVYIAPGGKKHMVLQPGSDRRIKLIESDLVNGHRPSVDMLFRSVSPLGKSAVGAILTGMGNDGAEGLLAMRQAGARTYAQSRDDCVVWGMPRAAINVGAVQIETSLSKMATTLLNACRGAQKQET